MSEPIDIDRARKLVLDRAQALPAEQVALGDALDRVLAEDAHAPWPVPRFANSAMDGFAVRAVDTASASPDSPVRLTLVGESRAGRPAEVRLSEGQAVPVSTGAMMPGGADAVVRAEDGRRDASGHVDVLGAVAPGHDVREAGEDINQGQRAIAKGTVLGPAELGVLASLGLAKIACSRRARVAVLTTGDELLEPDGEQGGARDEGPGADQGDLLGGGPRWDQAKADGVEAGGVYNSNAYSIGALVKRCGAELWLRRTVPDDAQATEAAIVQALSGEVAIVCGGVSVGAHDHVRPALGRVGAQEVFWRLALRPGGPAWFGLAPGGGLLFGLPGNPVSAIVTFLLLVRPALRALAGAAPERDRTEAIFDEPYAKQPGRAHAVRCRLELLTDGWHARPTGPQGSHVLTSMLGVDALALIPADSAGVRPGQAVEVELLRRS